MPTTNSWGNTVAAAGVTFNGGTFAAGTDALDNAVNIGTLANAGRTTTIGNTTAASVLALKYGTGDFTLASATGTVMSALDTGEVTMPLQPAFLAGGNAVANVSGDGTAYTITWGETIDRNGDYDGTSTFTAPVTGFYMFCAVVECTDWNVAITRGNFNIVTSNRPFGNFIMNWNPVVNANDITLSTSCLCDMDAGDTCTVRINFQNGAKQIDFAGGTFSGILLS